VAQLKLFKGGVWIAGRKSPNSLYDPKIASFEEAGGYNQADADGFIRLAGVRLRALARATKKGGWSWEKSSSSSRRAHSPSSCPDRAPEIAITAITRWTSTSRIPTVR